MGKLVGRQDYYTCSLCGRIIRTSVSIRRYVREDGVVVTQHRAATDGDLDRIRESNVHEIACARKRGRHLFTLEPLEAKER